MCLVTWALRCRWFWHGAQVTDRQHDYHGYKLNFGPEEKWQGQSMRTECGRDIHAGCLFVCLFVCCWVQWIKLSNKIKKQEVILDCKLSFICSFWLAVCQWNAPWELELTSVVMSTGFWTFYQRYLFIYLLMFLLFFTHLFLFCSDDSGPSLTFREVMC